MKDETVLWKLNSANEFEFRVSDEVSSTVDSESSGFRLKFLIVKKKPGADVVILTLNTQELSAFFGFDGNCATDLEPIFVDCPHASSDDAYA